MLRVRLITATQHRRDSNRTAPTAGQAALRKRLFTAPGLVPASYYCGFYVREALRHAGLGDRYIELLQPWREMLALGLTTTPERQEPTRSDTHAWSAHPNYGLFANALGIRPLTPGFKSVLVAPHPGPLARWRAACLIPRARSS